MIDPTALIDPKADIHPTAEIGALTRVWAYAGVLAHCVIGNGVSIGRQSEIGRGTVVGDRSRIGWGCFFPPNSKIGNNVFIGPGVVCTDDRHPVVPSVDGASYNAQPPVIEDNASLGARVTLVPGIRIGRGARVAAGAVVTRDVPAGGAVRGVPAHPFDAPVGWRPDMVEQVAC